MLNIIYIKDTFWLINCDHFTVHFLSEKLDLSLWSQTPHLVVWFTLLCFMLRVFL